MSLSLHTRRARLLAVRGLIDAAGGGALQLHAGIQADTPETPAASAPRAIIALAPISFELHETEASMSLVPAAGNAALSGAVTWARYVDGAGTAVYDCTAGPPGSGADLIVSDLAGAAVDQVYTGGEITVSHTIIEP